MKLTTRFLLCSLGLLVHLAPLASWTAQTAAPTATVVAWGVNDYGETNVPAGLTGVVAIAAGYEHTVVLKADGSVLAWGWNSYGQANVPAGLSGVTAIAAGYEHTLALKTDGSVVAWGRNDLGQATVPVAAQSGVTAIAGGANHTVALKNDGSVLAWGYNAYGQTTVPVAAQSGVTAIAAWGANHTVALKTDGSVLAWGYNAFGQTDVPVAAQSGVVAIASGTYHTVALKNDGSVVAWGLNGSGQTKVPVAAQSGVTAIAAGFYHTVALKNDGTVVVWGANVTNVPAGLSGVTAIAAGGFHAVALVGTAPPITLSIISQPANQTVNAGQNVSFTVTATGTAPLSYQWQFNEAPISGATSATLTLNTVLPGKAGRYSVRVSNALGSITSRAATLAVQADPANGTPQTPVTIPVPSAKSAGQNNLIVITHGWLPGLLISPLNANWVDDMAATIQQKLADKNMNNWQVLPIKWEASSKMPTPDIALLNATIIGTGLGKTIGASKWNHVHLIGHSAGAALIQEVAYQIKNTPNNTTTVHTTFLDPYIGVLFENRGLYGQNADWSDTYFARDVTGVFTRGVPNSHSVDVTNLDDEQSFFEIVHSWPYKFYTRTVTDGFRTLLGDTSFGYGFPLSMEGGGWANRGNYPIPNTTPVTLSGASQLAFTFTFPPNLPQNIRPVTDYSKLTVSGTDAIPALLSQTGTLQLDNGGLFFQSGNIIPQPQPQSVRAMGTVSPASGPVLQPAWVSLGVTVTNLVNYVKFDAGFTSTAGAQGLFSVYWGTNLIGSLDERTATTGLHPYRFALPATYPAGQYTLGFRLDAYASTPSSLTLTNVITGFIGLTNPPALTVAPNVTNGAPQVTLTGATGFYSILQSSTNFVNWTPIAALVNTNGVVQFTDTGMTNQPRRFYRAVVP